MKFEKAKQVLSEEIKRAINFDRCGNVTMRQQVLLNIQDLPLPNRYIDDALKSHNLYRI